MFREITELRPDWLEPTPRPGQQPKLPKPKIRKSRIRAPKPVRKKSLTSHQGQLLARALEAGSVPSWGSERYLYACWQRIKRAGGDLYNQIITARPDWLEGNVKRAKITEPKGSSISATQTALIELATSGAASPPSTDPRLYACWRRCRKSKSGVYQRIAELRPDWLEAKPRPKKESKPTVKREAKLPVIKAPTTRTLTAIQQELLNCAKSGSPRPTYHQRSLYDCWCDGRRRQSSVYREIIELRPDWIGAQSVRSSNVQTTRRCRPNPEPKAKMTRKPVREPFQRRPINRGNVETILPPESAPQSLLRSIDQWVDRDPSAALWAPPMACKT